MSRAAAVQSCTSLAVLVPCYNEAATIAVCVEQLLELEGIATFLLIDDGSQDGSSAICAALAARHAPRVEALLLPQNVGKSAAVRAGASAVSAEFLVVLDADMTVAPASVRSVLEALSGGSAGTLAARQERDRAAGGAPPPRQELRASPRVFAYGSRLHGNMTRGAMSLAHRLGNRFFAAWVSLLLHREVGDVLCGLKALPKDVLSNMPPSACRWGDFDLFFAAADAGLRFVEIPVAFTARRAGHSKMRAFSAGLYFAYLCAGRTLRGLLHTIRRKSLAAT
jgi:glycosyltransferase involved in cell wall biosynthesis